MTFSILATGCGQGTNHLAALNSYGIVGSIHGVRSAGSNGTVPITISDFLAAKYAAVSNAALTNGFRNTTVTFILSTARSRLCAAKPSKLYMTLPSLSVLFPVDMMYGGVP
jgi:hypothetical protein